MITEQLKIRDCFFSEGFKAVMQEENIQTVKDLLSRSKEQLTSIPNFTFQMLVEYREFIEANKLDSK